MKDNIIEFYLTGLFIGKINYMPGTFGTLLGVLIFFFLSNNSLIFNIILLCIFFIISIYILDLAKYRKIFRKVDDKSIVIDEIFGYLFFMIFFEPTLENIIIGFILFRIFDILKPYPIFLIDNNLKNSVGIMLDDILAAIYSGLILFIFNYAIKF